MTDLTGVIYFPPMGTDRDETILTVSVFADPAGDGTWKIQAYAAHDDDEEIALGGLASQEWDGDEAWIEEIVSETWHEAAWAAVRSLPRTVSDRDAVDAIRAAIR